MFRSYGSRTFQGSLFRNPGAMSEMAGAGAEARDPRFYSDGWQDLSGAARSWAPLGAEMNSLVSDAGAIVLAETALNMHCWGKNPVVSTVLQLNGQDRFSERSGKWFDLVQPYKYHTHLPDTGINVYSFALLPEQYNPSGTCNFSRLDNTNLRLKISGKMFNSRNESVMVKAYAVNYNILRVMSGMAGVAFSS